MAKVAFVGACNKSDVIMYIARILRGLDCNVAVVDPSEDQKYKFRTQIIDAKEVHDEHDGVHILYGGNPDVQGYDTIFYDITTMDELTSLQTQFDMAFVCTTYSKYSIMVTEKLVDALRPNVDKLRAIFFHVGSSIDADYVIANVFANDTNIVEIRPYIIYDDEYRKVAQIENEHNPQICFRPVPKEMKTTISEIVGTEFGHDEKQIKLVMKQLDKRGRR